MHDLVTTDQRGRTQIVLLAGFLGSGKTTLLKNILASEQDLSDIAVLVNEFGSVGIDGDILRQAGTDVIELASGCICCSIQKDLTRTLKDIYDRFHPKTILIEATGVAEPEAVAAVLEEPEMRQRMHLKKIITVLDIRFWIGREKFGPFFLNQVHQADIILLNKIDRVDEALVSKSLEEIHLAIPGSRVLPTLYSQIDPEVIWGGGARAHQHGGTPDHDHEECFSIDLRSLHHPHGHHHGGHQFTDFSFVDHRPLHEERFKSFLEQLPWELFRAKGPVRFSDRTMLLNYVGGQCDWEPWNDGQATRLAFVGWKINGEELLEKLEQCILLE